MRIFFKNKLWHRRRPFRFCSFIYSISRAFLGPMCRSRLCYVHTHSIYGRLYPAYYNYWLWMEHWVGLYLTKQHTWLVFYTASWPQFNEQCPISNFQISFQVKRQQCCTSGMGNNNCLWWNSLEIYLPKFNVHETTKENKRHGIIGIRELTLPYFFARRFAWLFLILWILWILWYNHAQLGRVVEKM